MKSLALVALLASFAAPAFASAPAVYTCRSDANGILVWNADLGQLTVTTAIGNVIQKNEGLRYGHSRFFMEVPSLIATEIVAGDQAVAEIQELADGYRQVQLLNSSIKDSTFICR